MNGIFCPWCGRDVRVNASGRLVAHHEGDRGYVNIRRCCGSGASREEINARGEHSPPSKPRP